MWLSPFVLFITLRSLYDHSSSLNCLAPRLDHTLHEQVHFKHSYDYFPFLVKLDKRVFAVFNFTHGACRLCNTSMTINTLSHFVAVSAFLQQKITGICLTSSPVTDSIGVVSLIFQRTTDHGACHRLPTVFYFHLVKGTWSVEFSWYTNRKDKMVLNGGTKSSHMSWAKYARTGISSIWQRTWSLVPVWCKYTCSN